MPTIKDKNIFLLKHPQNNRKDQQPMTNGHNENPSYQESARICGNMLGVSFDDAAHKVTHNYHDHANDPAGGYGVQEAAGGSGTEQSFPMRLHYMLNDIQQDNLSHIVSWMPHGRCKLMRFTFLTPFAKLLLTTHILRVLIFY